MSSPVVEQSTAISKELDYKLLKYSHPTYQFSKLLPLSGGQNVNLTATNGNQEVLIEVPTKAFNISESYLSWTHTIPAQGNNLYSWVHADTIPELNTVELYTRNGQYLARIEDANVHLQTLRPINTSIDEFLTYSAPDGLEPLNALIANAVPVFPNANASYVSRVNEKRYMFVSGNNGAQVLVRRFPLKAFSETFLSYDKTVMFPEVLILRLVFNGSRVGFQSSSAVNVAGAPTVTASLTLTGNNAIQNICMYLAVEQNQEVINSLAEKIKGGLDLMIPYVKRVKTQLGAVTSATISVRMSRGDGAVCKRIYHTLGFVNESGANATYYDHSNIGADRDTALKVSEYYTMLDNNRIQQFNLRGSLNEGSDFLVNKKYIEKSVIQNQDQYSYNWVHIEDFSDKQIGNKDQQNNMITGLDLSIERKWDLYATSLANSAFNHYTFICTLKSLKITPSLITVL